MKFYYFFFFVIIVLFCIWKLTPKVITPSWYKNAKYFKYEKQYMNIEAYTSSCNHVEILIVALNYRKKENYKKCKEWIRRKEICISLHPEFNLEYVNETNQKICEKNIILPKMSSPTVQTESLNKK